ncbi:D-alanyl-D-alanine carboxypeptidase [Herbihabitans rhizosphaerae]|uniref:D-alanyl-D-alanine carboxypeptidase n=1 Tax=Herbihabitans rhizosphaerae TaxID=1872711 RepID=A0A4Q7KF15_9PSEU|nr:serine hydrolase domain-containing protein [Herbihabitans rhizosphaerae]RZS32452.1 D-alanyl-D-alanine carboxypeptidase [Herbihabitans rhizosphaerae]
MTFRKRGALAAVAAVALTTAVVASSPAAAQRNPVTGAVQAELDLLTSVDRIPGALAQIRDRHGRSVTVTSGTAELGTGRPMVSGTDSYRVASVAKSVTAVAVLRLVADHRVELDAPIETYLPGLVQGTGEGVEIDGRDITVRQLLQHTSGLSDYTRYLVPFDPLRRVEPMELVRLSLAHKPDFAPGKGQAYSNTAFIVAGMLVERLTGKDIRTAMADLVIRPAGLHDTYWPATGDTGIRGRHARNYMLDKTNPQGPLVDATAFEPSLLGAGGALVSTPADLNKFWRELFGGRLLPGRMLAEMQTAMPPPPGGPNAGFGLGLMRIPLTCGGDAWGHDGDLLGVGTWSARNASGREATVYMTAQTGSHASKQLRRTLDVALCTPGRDGLD